MGIPGFYGRWLSNNVKQAIVDGVPQLVSSVSLDFNGIAHQARQNVLGENNRDPQVAKAIINTPPEQLQLEIFNEVDNVMLQIIQAFRPRDTLIIAIDGVAPGGKMQQQKGRREKAARDQLGNLPFGSNVITPGTEFMINLDQHIVRFIAKYRDYLPRKVIYSSHLEPGEGEHKIMDYYRAGEVSDGLTIAQGGVHILYGLDADLFMLAMLTPLDNIYISRKDDNEVVSINVIKEYLLTRSTNPDDFVVMMFLIGNDFLPHIPALEQLSETIDMLLTIYSQDTYKLTRPLDDDTERREINWVEMSRFIKVVAEREDDLLAGLSVRAFKYPSRFLQGALIGDQFYPQNFRSLWYQNALGTRGTPEFVTSLQQIIARYVPDYRDYLLNPIMAETVINTISDVTAERVEKMVNDYLKTMSWVYLYYCEGTTAVNHDWAYPYYHTPMIADIASVLDRVTFNTGVYQSYEGMVVFTALHQLLAVLPVRSQSLIPQEIQSLMDYDSPIRDLYPTKFIVELDGKEYEHQGVPIVPLIDRRRILNAMGQMRFSPSRLLLWEPATTLRFVRSPEEEERVKMSDFMLQRQLDFQTRQSQRGTRGRGRGERGTYRGRGDRGDQRGRGRDNFGGPMSVDIAPAPLGQVTQPTMTRGGQVNQRGRDGQPMRGQGTRGTRGGPFVPRGGQRGQYGQGQRGRGGAPVTQAPQNAQQWNQMDVLM